MGTAENVQYLTAGQVARLLHVSPKTISRWAARGLIPCVVTLGGHRRFDPGEVEEIRRRMTREQR
jgi:excisionase family DNA binding protein